SHHSEQGIHSAPERSRAPADPARRAEPRGSAGSRAKSADRRRSAASKVIRAVIPRTVDHPYHFDAVLHGKVEDQVNPDRNEPEPGHEIGAVLSNQFVRAEQAKYSWKLSIIRSAARGLLAAM